MLTLKVLQFLPMLFVGCLSLSGLKQASRKWFVKFYNTLCLLGFDKCNGDHTLFVKKSAGQFFVVIVYVDNILIASTSDEAAAELTNQLSAHFILRVPKFFLGLEIARSNAGIFINQRKNATNLLAYSGFS